MMSDLISKRKILQTLTLVQGDWENKNKSEDKEITIDGWNTILFEETKKKDKVLKIECVTCRTRSN